MDIGRYIIWILLVIVAYLLLSCPRFLLRDHGGTVLRILLILGKFVAAIFIAYVIVAVNTRMAWKGGLFFAALYAVLLADAAADLLTIPYGKKKGKQKGWKVGMILSALCTAVLVLYGTVNMQMVHPAGISRSGQKLSVNMT